MEVLHETTDYIGHVPEETEGGREGGGRMSDYIRTLLDLEGAESDHSFSRSGITS